MSKPSFAQLKGKRTGTPHVLSNSEQLAIRPSENAAGPSYDGLDLSALEIRQTADAGRSLFAKRPYKAGETLIKVAPYVRLLDKIHIPVLCSNCMQDVHGQEKLLRCSNCKAAYYCSSVFT